jgi:hypothetical protein
MAEAAKAGRRLKKKLVIYYNKEIKKKIPR